MALAEEYREKVQSGLGLEGSKASDDLVALCFAKDLMRGDPATCKAGYTAENAALAARELFPAADQKKLEAGLGLCEPEPEPSVCQICGAPLDEGVSHPLGSDRIRKPGTCFPDLCMQRVVIVETHLGHNEQVEYLIKHPIVLTADHIELTVRRLIAHAKETLKADVVLVADAMDWVKADEWLEQDTPEREAERQNRAVFGG
jgi:hypothetical protein